MLGGMDVPYKQARRREGIPPWILATLARKACRRAPQRTHLPHISSVAVFSHAAWKLLLQIPPHENSLIHTIPKKTNTKYNYAKPTQPSFAAELWSMARNTTDYLAEYYATSTHHALSGTVGYPWAPT